MLEAEYMRIQFKYFPTDIIESYGLNELKAEDGNVYIKIKKDMYGLKKAAILAYENLVSNLTNGEGKLTLADLNEESAKLLALQTRQQLGINSLALAAQSERSILALFG